MQDRGPRQVRDWMERGSGPVPARPGREGDAAPAPASRHLFIAGTGRAGTSFLVRWLTELGLDTHLTRNGQAAQWHEEAAAGLEDDPLRAAPGTLPYVVKSPWLYEFVEELLADPRFALDGVIVPVRDLDAAAASRVVIERQAIHASQPWMAERRRDWSNWGYVPGGMLHSLEPLDQARILATGFHRLLERLTAADVPVALISFPRIVEDGGYLFQRLRHLLPSGISREAALEAHERVASVDKVRLGRETGEAGGLHGARTEDIALRREIVRLRNETASLRAKLAVIQAQARDAQEAAAAARGAVLGLQTELATARTRAALADNLAAEARSDLLRVRRDLDVLRASRTWRATAPMRRTVEFLRRALRRRSSPAST